MLPYCVSITKVTALRRPRVPTCESRKCKVGGAPTGLAIRVEIRSGDPVAQLRALRAQTGLAVVDHVAQRVFLARAGRELLLRDLMGDS
jgi:hypothetical protein